MHRFCRPGHDAAGRVAPAGRDPAATIEPIFGTDRDATRDAADSVLREAGKDICTAGSNAGRPPIPVTWTGTMLFTTSDTYERKGGKTGIGGFRQDAGDPDRHDALPDLRYERVEG